MKNLIEINKRFFDKIARFYDCGLLKILLVDIQKKTLDFIKPKKNSLILDDGCGTGNLLELFGKDFQLSGIDISPEMLKIAEKKLGKRVKFKLMQAEKLDLKNKFNYIFSIETFHHFTDHNKIMDNFYSALKRNGKLVIVDLNFGKPLNWIFHKFEPGNTKMFSKEEFENLFRKHNFKNIWQKRIGLAILTIGSKKSYSKTFK